MDHDAHRSPQDVFDEHLHNRQHGWIADQRTFARNYAGDVVLLTGMGVFRGRDGVRQPAQILEDQLPGVTYEQGRGWSRFLLDSHQPDHGPDDPRHRHAGPPGVGRRAVTAGRR